MVHTVIPATQKAEAGGLQFQAQAEQLSKTAPCIPWKKILKFILKLPSSTLFWYSAKSPREPTNFPVFV